MTSTNAGGEQVHEPDRAPGERVVVAFEPREAVQHESERERTERSRRATVARFVSTPGSHATTRARSGNSGKKRSPSVADRVVATACDVDVPRRVPREQPLVDLDRVADRSASSSTTSRVSPSATTTNTRDKHERNDHRARRFARRRRRPIAPRSRIACRDSAARRELLRAGLLEEVFGRRPRARRARAGCRARPRSTRRHRDGSDSRVPSPSRSCPRPARATTASANATGIGGVEAFLVVDPVDERRRCEIGIRHFVEAARQRAGAPTARAGRGNRRRDRPAGPRRRGSPPTSRACVRCSVALRTPPTSPSTDDDDEHRTCTRDCRRSAVIPSATSSTKNGNTITLYRGFERLAREVAEGRPRQRAWRRRAAANHRAPRLSRTSRARDDGGRARAAKHAEQQQRCRDQEQRPAFLLLAAREPEQRLADRERGQHRIAPRRSGVCALREKRRQPDQEHQSADRRSRRRRATPARVAPGRATRRRATPRRRPRPGRTPSTA